MTYIPYIAIKKQDAQRLINALKNYNKISFFNKEYKIIEKENTLYFPLKRDVEQKIKDDLKDRFNFQIIPLKGERDPSYKARSLEEALRNKIPSKAYKLIPHSYDLVGTVAIVEFDRGTQVLNRKKIKKKVAEAIIEVNNNVKTVYEKRSKIGGTYRLRKLKFLTGLRGTITIHKENHCKFKIDLNKVFFSPRLNFERKRISSLNIKDNECIADLFAGVGAFSVQLAKYKKVLIHAFDINPAAIKLLKENMQLNNLQGTIIPHKMDVKALLNPKNPMSGSLQNKIDRIIMNLPEHSLNYLDVACHLSKLSGTLLHIYQFSAKPHSVQRSIEKLRNKLNALQWMVHTIKNAKIVKSYSPQSNMIAIDALIKKSTPS
ncbi:MAG: tRNA (Guanine(37)-N1)-methyltransferase Trm5b [Promethearchaeota archaeon]|nr:MAG: tRNA (Guanine(37)-N1)-methyltransferase Trm5b [Candidatus Lokiarchaeota archaeon]